LSNGWGDIHTSLITYIRDALQPRLAPDLRARIEERVYVEFFDGAARQFVPHVHVYQTQTAQSPRGSGGAVAVAGEVAAAAEPFIVFVPLEIPDRYVQIIDVRSGGRIVTVIEVLSPANKSQGRGREEYRTKQRQTVEAGANLVEIDLHRSGEPITLSKPSLIPTAHRALYHASIYSGSHRDRLEYYRIPLRERLPRLPIPQRPTDPRVVLDLQAVLDTAYDHGRYDDIDYSQPLNPPLDPADEQWARELIAAASSRPSR
jgi:hypothetical protein